MKPILYTLRIPEEIAALIRGLHQELKKKIKAGLKVIMQLPDTGKILRDELAGLRSMRVSKLRITYRIPEREIQIVAVGPRIRIYDETCRLLQKEKRNST